MYRKWKNLDLLFNAFKTIRPSSVASASFSISTNLLAKKTRTRLIIRTKDIIWCLKSHFMVTYSFFFMVFYAVSFILVIFLRFYYRIFCFLLCRRCSIPLHIFYSNLICVRVNQNCRRGMWKTMVCIFII